MLLAGITVSMLFAVACDRDRPAMPPVSPAAPNSPLSLRETYDRLREWHANRSYLAIRPYIDPDVSDDVIDVLIAMDELLAANAGALQSIKKACPDLDPQAFDMSQMANQLELFSRDVEFVSLHEDGETGTVTVGIADRLPHRHIRFERRDGRWVYMPGPGAKDLIPVTRAVTGALSQVALVVSQGPQAPHQIEAEYRLRVGWKLKKAMQQADRAAH